METYVIIFIVVVIILISIQGQIQSKNHSKWKVKAEEICKSIPEITVTQFIAPKLGSNNHWYLALDEENETIVHLNKEFNKSIIQFKKILESELIMDGASYHKSSTIGTLGRTLAGGG